MSKILEKTFSSLENLNEFIDKNPVEYISISTKEVEKYGDLPLPNGKIWKYKDTIYVLFYKEIEI